MVISYCFSLLLQDQPFFPEFIKTSYLFVLYSEKFKALLWKGIGILRIFLIL